MWLKSHQGVWLSLILALIAVPVVGQDQPAPETQEDNVTQGEFAILLVREIAGERDLPIAATMTDYIKFLQYLGLEPLGGWEPDDELTTGDLVSLLKLEDMGRVVKRELVSTLKAPKSGESDPKNIEVPDNAYADKFEVAEKTPAYVSGRIMASDGDQVLCRWTPKSAKRNLRDVVLETGNYPFIFDADASLADVEFTLRYLEHSQRPVTIEEVRAILAAQVEMPFVLPQFMPQISPGSPRLD